MTMTRERCPHCGRSKPGFAIRDGRCDECLKDEARATTPHVQSTADRWATIRAERARRLAACDWTQVADTPVPLASVTAWRTYRQRLRDITTTYATPEQVQWPIPPG